MNISLIANSGIQFHKFDLSIDANKDVIKTMGFYEYFNRDTLGTVLEYAVRLDDEDIWVAKKRLQEEKYLDENGGVKDGVNFSIVKIFALTEDEEYHTVGSISDCLEYFASQKGENIWLPIPYFSKISKQKVKFGPTAWARMILKDVSLKSDKQKKYKVILAFDTKTTDIDNDMFAPNDQEFSNDGSLIFNLSNNENHNLEFCQEKYGCGWVAAYLKEVYYRDLDYEERLKKEENPQFPHYKYLGRYLYLIKYLATLEVFPQVEMYSEKEESVDVDLVLDMGNSNTCGLLFESPNEKNKAFDFNKCQKLKINDLSEPDKEYNDPFSMRLVFAEAKFGLGDRAEMSIIEIPEKKRPFRWLGLLRVGKEAARLINTYNLDIGGKEVGNHHSSPKRYLWDKRDSDIPWRFINKQKEYITIPDITTHFDKSGELVFAANPTEPYYSKKSLMTFVYIEILLHAIAQINSYEFRERHGSPSKPRKLKRITITCPTSIVQHEQVVLRKCAEEAVKVLNLSFSESILGRIDNGDKKPTLEIIPSPRDLAKKLNSLSEKKDWIYDEATCGQLVFLYGEISQRYLNKADIFFNLYGKKRDDVTDTNRKALTIGSIDIGGGTTDLMICAYQYEDGQSMAVVKPHPLYWESFNLAGDDLLKDIVQQIVLEGKPGNADEEGCKGVIENAARAKGVQDVAVKMNDFFGVNSNRTSYMHRTIRKNFVVQVAVPIALRYLQHAIEDKADCEVGFNDLFLENKPNQSLIDYFNKHFTIKFEEIKWKLSKKRVFSILELVFDPILKPLSVILSAYGCDFVLLAGKPATIPKIREMFIKYYPVSPDRIITLNQYRVGKWYPFQDGVGYFEDPKTIVAVGASIALMGGALGKLEGFRLNTDLLRRRLIATADYIGTFEKSTNNIDIIYLDPDTNSCEIEVPALPITLGYKQLPNANYRSRPIYKLTFDDVEIRKRVLSQNSLLTNEKEISEAVESQKNKLQSKMPFKVTLKRQLSESKEVITIERIKDANRDEPSRSILSLSVMTLAEESGYWLDTGEFVLNIKK